MFLEEVFHIPYDGRSSMSADDSLEHHSAHLNGIKQHYVRAGSGPAVMLLHGWPQTWYEWRHVIGLLGTEFTVVAPDLRGFGYSSKPASGYDATTIAADLTALSAHLGLKDVTVVGHIGVQFSVTSTPPHTPTKSRLWASWRWSCPASA
jgi:hypothetical protein